MTEFDMLLAAIGKQRWYFFENNGKIIFDSKTGLLWANLNYFPYSNCGSAYSHYDNYAEEVKTLLRKINSQSWGGYRDWQLPTSEELWQMIEDKTFPYQQGDNWRIKGKQYWYVTGGRKDLDYGGTGNVSNYDDGYVLPCSRALRLADFKYSPQAVLDIFVENNLVPKFDDEEITLQYFINAPSILTLRRLKKFNAAAVNKSPIQYHKTVAAFADEMLVSLQKYEKQNAATITEITRVSTELNAPYAADSNLTAEENALLEARQKELARRLELDLDLEDVRAQIAEVKAEALELASRIDKINHGKNIIGELAALEAEPRVSFEVLVENVVGIISVAHGKVEAFAPRKDFTKNILDAWADWTADYKNFKTNLREEFHSACRRNSIDEEIIGGWYEDWRKVRFAIEQRFQPLIEYAVSENFSEFVKALNVLRDYKANVDSFYLNERRNIYMKFAFQTGGDLQEKFETEYELNKLAENFQRALQEIIFAREKSEERIFLLRWAEPLTNIPLDEIIAFVQDKELTAIPAAVLEQFAELRRRNFESYLADSQAYSDALLQREQEYNALVFRMRQGLKGK